MRYLLAIIFLCAGLFFLMAAKQIGRHTHRTRSLIGEISPRRAQIFGVAALFLGAIWLFY